MALTRKMLAAMDIPAEKIDEIINAHSETVNALKEERDRYKTDADQLPQIKKDLEVANTKLENLDGETKKYSDLKAEFDQYKADVEAKASRRAKESAYKKLLAEAGVSEKRIGTVMKVSDINSIELDKAGNIKNSDKLAESIKTEWADFIVTQSTQGANTANPPANNGGSAMSKDEIMKIKDTEARQKAWTEYLSREGE